MALKALSNKATPKLNTKRRQLEHDLEHITQEMYRRNKELNDTNRTLSLLRAIDSLVLESHDSLKLLSGQISAAISGATQYPLVAILGPSSLKTDRLEVYGANTTSGIVLDDLLKEVKPTTRHHWFKIKERSSLISLHRADAKQISYFLGCGTDTAEKLKAMSIHSLYAAKLMARQQLVGVMVVGSSDPMSSFEAPDIALLERLSEAVGIAMDNKLLSEENQQVLLQLKKANHRLKELDQTKDEFISMASHQLRTPLTTIKGYLSMVLEGDVGKLNKKEQDMLQQAYGSAENMVFLIADLLNVSRLQSGKFVIENTPTDLSQMAETEVTKLQESAANHGLTLSYKKPDKVPIVNLDETKIRQVVMNFIDNAIYYTPKGGSVTVEVQATDKEISYTVSDTGVGVPRAIQSHLFTKFYRAENAKKMRPDGTGLGLFMAKKVIIAQGGAIIFKSVEGKGSTFGFSFPLSKVAVKGDVKPAETTAVPVPA